MTNFDNTFIDIPLQHLPSPSAISKQLPPHNPYPTGPAKYISRLFPSYIHPASPITIEHILRSSQLSPFSSISLSACIVDALSHTFYRSWLLSLPNSLDIIYPEIILVACLSISVQFTNDSYHFKSVDLLEKNLLSTFNICILNSTQNCPFLANESILKDLESRILSDINYDLWPLLSNHGLSFMTKQFREHGLVIDYSDCIQNLATTS